MARSLTLDELQEQARAYGYVLVRRRRVANWHSVLLDLIRQKRLIYAIKLWAEVADTDLSAAKDEIEAICSLNADPPNGTEHPDIPADSLAYYREPWRYKLTMSDVDDAAQVDTRDALRLARRQAAERGKPFTKGDERRIARAIRRQYREAHDAETRRNA